MNDNMDTKNIERKAYFNYHKDGIIDIYLGLATAFAAISLLDVEVSLFWMIALFPIFYRDSKRRYTFPRLGYVKFRTGNSRNTTMLATGLAAASFLVGLLVFFSGMKQGFAWMVPIIENWKLAAAGITLVVLSLFGYVSELKRLYYYGIASFLVFLAGALMPIKGYLLLVTIGGVICLNGVYMLYKFIKEYPLETRPENE
jgi:hypothetical protein